MNTIMQLQDSGDAMPCQAALTTLVETQHSQCLMCGPANPAGLKLKFKVQADGSVLAAFPCRQALQSYPNTLHGGIVAALLDSAMTNALFAIGVVAVTAELTVRYQAPVNPERVVVLRAGLEKPRCIRCTTYKPASNRMAKVWRERQPSSW